MSIKIFCVIIQEIIIETLTKGYFVKKAFKGMFLVFLIVKIIDFVTDITINVRFYHPNDDKRDSIFSNLPSNETCVDEQNNFNSTLRLECYFHQMNEWMLFSSSIAIFALTYTIDAFFVMTDENSKQYKAIMVPGVCCWENVWRFVVFSKGGPKMAPRWP